MSKRLHSASQVRVPAPRTAFESPAASLRRRLVAQTSTAELRRRLAAARQSTR